MALPGVQEHLHTVDDLWELSHDPEYDEQSLWLIDGELYEMPPASGEHGGIALGIGAQILLYVSAHKLGYATAAETGYVLFKNSNGKDTVLAPDVGFISKERLPNGLPPRYVPAAPDLAVEVVSPTDKASEVDQKVASYLRYGTRLVWVIYPKTRTVIAHSANSIHRFSGDDMLDGGDVLPGFRLTVREVFET